MDIDHIFIFTNDNGKIADELVKFGLTEGSSIVYAFDDHKNGLTKEFEKLNLKIKY